MVRLTLNYYLTKHEMEPNKSWYYEFILQAKLLPLEEAYDYHDFVSAPLNDPDFDAKPMVLFVGQYSTGKTSLIRYLLERDYPGLRIGPGRMLGVIQDGCTLDCPMKRNYLCLLRNRNYYWWVFFRCPKFIYKLGGLTTAEKVQFGKKDGSVRVLTNSYYLVNLCVSIFGT